MMVPEDKEEGYQALVETFRAAGAADAETWASSEVTENVAQLARFCFLRSLWPRAIDFWRENAEWIDFHIRGAVSDPKGCFADAGLAMQRLLELGATRDELASIARMVAYSAAFRVIHRIDEGVDWDFNQQRGYPESSLIELGPDDQPTGRSVDALHESLLSMDPSGRRGVRSDRGSRLWASARGGGARLGGAGSPTDEGASQRQEREVDIASPLVTDLDDWVGAAELAEGAMGDPPGPTIPPYAARRRFARRSSVHSGR